jgi:hypothetical protein
MGDGGGIGQEMMRTDVGVESCRSVVVRFIVISGHRK